MSPAGSSAARVEACGPARAVVLDLLMPAVFYGALFVVLTWPLAASFSTHFWADAGDGMQGAWNLWWFPKAVLELRSNPWWTDHLHYPHGTSLLGHNLMEFDGLLAIAMHPFLSLAETHNAVVFLSFVLSGLATYGLALHVSGSRAASLFAGFVFTFSNNHFAHAEGHLHVVSMEWLPVFVWLWLKLLEAPSAARGAACALVLALNLLCAPYFFVYGVMIAALLGWDWARDQGGLRSVFARGDLRVAMLSLLGVGLLTSGPWIGGLLWLHASDPLLGAHSARSHSMDLLAPLIPGGHWIFAEWTRPYWSRIPSNIHESSVHMGLGVLASMWLVWRSRTSLRASLWRPWMLLALVFGVLSLGPGLFVAGFRLLPWGMPYAYLQLLFPPLQLAGVPVRMMIVVQLAAAVLCAVALSRCWPKGARGRVALAALLAWTSFEYWPRPVTVTEAEVPAWVEKLRELPGDGVVDLTTRGGFRRLVYQAVHEKRVVGGYLSRVPQSVSTRSEELLRAAREGTTARLCEAGVRYLLLGSDDSETRHAAALPRYADDEVQIFELSCGR